MTRTCTLRVSPARNSGTSVRSDWESRTSRVFIAAIAFFRLRRWARRTGSEQWELANGQPHDDATTGLATRNRRTSEQVGTHPGGSFPGLLGAPFLDGAVV